MSIRSKMRFLIMIMILSNGLAAAKPDRVHTPMKKTDICEYSPPNAQPTDGRYRLRLSGDPTHFIPGARYIVDLETVKEDYRQIVGFNISMEALNQTEPELGTLESFDNLSKPHEICKETLTNATSQATNKVHVIWNAPPYSWNECVRLSACLDRRPAKGRGKMFRRSVLALDVCAPEKPTNFPERPKILPHCCACDEAVYKIEFESLWSEHFHLRELPLMSGRTGAQFSDVIGASHSLYFYLWEEGYIPTPGVKSLAESGSTKALHEELNAKVKTFKMKFIMKSISWQQLHRSDKPKTYTLFRVDSSNHLMTLVSKMYPSQNWIVGVHNYELCNPNCTWTDVASVPLYPYETNPDNGITLLAEQRTGESWGRPFARLLITKSKQFKKKCDVPSFFDASERRSRHLKGADRRARLRRNQRP
ncbi:hypothetical protein ACJJTC_017837 [Scirpophaga incertulas]